MKKTIFRLITLLCASVVFAYMERSFLQKRTDINALKGTLVLG